MTAAAVGELAREPVAAATARVSAPDAARTAPRALLVTRWVLVSTAGLAVWMLLFGTVAGRIQENRSQTTLYQEFRQQLAEATAPVSSPIRLGSPVALLSIPRLGLHDVVVVQGSASRQTALGPGHRSDSVLPGQSGISAVYGRAVSYGGPFRNLTSLRPGDKVTVVTGQGRFVYDVQGMRHRGDVIPALPTGAGRLTLATAETGGRAGRWAATSTVYVDALLEKAAAPGPVGAASTDEAPMRGDGGALVPLVFWLELLLGVALGVVWAQNRWGARPTWIVGGVALLAALWGSSEAVWAALPNLV